MAVHTEKITDKVARALPTPEKGYSIYWCPRTEGFGVRVTSTGARAWIAERRVNGETVRRTLGKVTGAAAITADAARRQQIDVSSELQNGRDRLDERRAQAAAAKADAMTLAEGVRIYCRDKRRRHGKDFLALKERTKEDYLAMIEPAGVTKKGVTTMPGELHSLAAKPMHKIKAGDIQAVHKELGARGERRQSYAMQLLRAVLRFHGITITDNPLAPTTAGAKRIHIALSEGDPSPIPADKLGAWWSAAQAQANASGDQLRAMLLAGARPGELPQLLVEQVDIDGGTFTMLDTKNRSDHTIVMSTQLKGIVERAIAGKRQRAAVFDVSDLRKVLGRVNSAAGTPDVTPHRLRHTFATVAEALVSTYVLKRMLNHATSGDVTATHYVQIDQARLRAGWQAVADYLDEAARSFRGGSMSSSEPGSR
jgi:integrase